MPVVTKEQLKIWFSNFKKPPEGEFWSWLDSYRHKLEKVPVDDVEGLTEKLQKKADLVDGVVPEHQLPFSVVTSEVITLGTVSHTDNVLNLAVHSSGANKVRVKGRTITRTFPNNWNTTPIADNGVKVIRGYAVKNEDDFFISEGAELPEFELPEIPEDALQLFIVTITQSGATIDTGGVGGFKTKAESGWKSLVFTSNLPRWIVLNSDESVFDIIAENGATPLISGLLTKGGKWIYPGKEYTLFNASGIDVIIRRNDVRPPFNPLAIANYLTFPVGADIIIKPGEYFRFKIKGTELVILSFGGGAKFPEVGNNADVLVKDTASEGGAKWSNRLTNAENAINTETVNRALADGNLQGQINTNTTAISTLNSHKSSVVDKMLHYWDASVSKWISSGVEVVGNAILKLKIINFGGYTISQKNAIASPTEGMFIYQNEAPKGFQKYENGAWSAVGNNISTADLTNVSARTFTQGNAFTWNTSGFLYALKGLLDKTGNASYTKVVVVHPTTGETVTRDFADPQATTLAVQNANTTQKTAMRTALLGVATPANPVLSAISPRFIERGKATYVDMVGLNLLLLDPAFIWIEKTDGTKVYATNFSNISNTVVSTQWTLPIDLPLGDYYVKIQNGFTVQGLSTALFTVTDVISSVSLLAIDWKRKLRLMPDGVTEYGIGAGTNTSTTNYVRTLDSEITGFNEINQLTWPAVVYKSQNIFPGNKDWDITINSTYLSGSGGNAPFFPYMGITETSHTGFTNINALSNIISVNSGARYLQIGNSGPTVDLASNPNYIIYISKVGSVIYLRFMFSNKTSLIYTQTSVDTSKDYAFFVQAAVTQAGRFVKMENTIFARIIE